MQALETWAEALADQSQGSRAPLELLLNTCQSKQTGPLRPADSLSTPRGQAAAFEQGLSTTWSSQHPDGTFEGQFIAFTLQGKQFNIGPLQVHTQACTDLQKLRCKLFYPCAPTSPEVKAR